MRLHCPHERAEAGAKGLPDERQDGAAVQPLSAASRKLSCVGGYSSTLRNGTAQRRSYHTRITDVNATPIMGK